MQFLQFAQNLIHALAKYREIRCNTDSAHEACEFLARVTRWSVGTIGAHGPFGAHRIDSLVGFLHGTDATVVIAGRLYGNTPIPLSDSADAPLKSPMLGMQLKLTRLQECATVWTLTVSPRLARLKDMRGHWNRNRA